jgi:hypothetical protein
MRRPAARPPPASARPRTPPRESRRRSATSPRTRAVSPAPAGVPTPARLRVLPCGVLSRWLARDRTHDEDPTTPRERRGWVSGRGSSRPAVQGVRGRLVVGVSAGGPSSTDALRGPRTGGLCAASLESLSSSGMQFVVSRSGARASGVAPVTAFSGLPAIKTGVRPRCVPKLGTPRPSAGEYCLCWFSRPT